MDIQRRDHDDSIFWGCHAPGHKHVWFALHGSNAKQRPDGKIYFVDEYEYWISYSERDEKASWKEKNMTFTDNITIGDVLKWFDGIPSYYRDHAKVIMSQVIREDLVNKIKRN